MPKPDESWLHEIEHTADLAVEVEAEDLPGLFRRAGLALSWFMVEPRGVARREVRRDVLVADGYEALLHDWLSHLLVRFLVEGFVTAEIEVAELTPGKIDAKVFGEALDLESHEFLTEIKAVTWHAISVVRSGNRWKARVVFDV